MYPKNIVFHGKIPPIMPPSCKSLLQLSVDVKVGYLYLYKDYTIIRNYGFEVEMPNSTKR
jgi:hypothetical protein